MAEPRYVARPVSFSQTNAKVNGGTMRGEEFVTHEVVDTRRLPLSRVICRTNRADAMMIVEALNGASRAEAVIQGERDARQLLSDILRQKDEAMGVLFARLSAAHVDCSDLIS